MIKNLNKSIDSFNAKPTATNQLKEAEETLSLLRELNDSIEKVKALTPGRHEASRIINQLSEALNAAIAIYLKQLDDNPMHITTEDLIKRPSSPK